MSAAWYLTYFKNYCKDSLVESLIRLFMTATLGISIAPTPLAVWGGPFMDGFVEFEFYAVVFLAGAGVGGATVFLIVLKDADYHLSLRD